MALTENAQRVYLGTNMANVARASQNFEHFNQYPSLFFQVD